MNLSLRNRVAASFISANLIVLVLGSFVFFFLDSLNEEIKSINVEIPGFYKISDLIRQSVDLFNNLFVEEKSVFRLSQQYSHFSLKPSKRTGKPNLDMPSKKINFNRYNI